MTLRLIQLQLPDGRRAVASLRSASEGVVVPGAESVYALARTALAEGRTVPELVAALGPGETIDPGQALAAGQVLPPVDHPDPAHLLLTGTGLTHLGSAEQRDQMHRKLDAEDLTDSLKMFKLGLEGGRPLAGETGVQPEWFYKGDGSMLAAPEAPLASPNFALDGGEEAEIAVIHVIDDQGLPRRLGYALANEFSDHVTERSNYLYLAHSKLRPAAIGPELLLGDLPAEIRGTSRIRRDGTILWESGFLSGETHMCHSLANLEAHHFKYRLFRRPGDVHVHFLGAAVLSCAAGVKTQTGDVFEIEADAFLLPLRNRLAVDVEAARLPAALY